MTAKKPEGKLPLRSQSEGEEGKETRETSSAPDARPKVVFLENPHAPDVFASTLHGVSRRHGNIHMAFATERFNHSANERTVPVIGRLVMPIEGVESMVVLLYGLLRDMGIDPLASPPKDQVQ